MASASSEPSTTPTAVTLAGVDDAAVGYDAVVIGLAAGPDGPQPVPVVTRRFGRRPWASWRGRTGPDARPGVEPWPSGTSGLGSPAVRAALVAAGAQGHLGEATTRAIPAGEEGMPAVVVAVGLGAPPEGVRGYEREVLRTAAGTAVRVLAGNRRVALALPLADPDAVQAAAEGALLGAYTFDRYRATTAGAVPAPVAEVTLLVPDPDDPDTQRALRRARVVAGAVCFARDLVNTPAADLPPATFAALVEAECRSRGMSVEVLDESALWAGGFGGICAVGQGSVNPPRLVRLTYPGSGTGPRVALVGNGITFDSGGLSLKPAEGMARMKYAMAGAAAVVAAARAAAELELAPRLEVWVPLAENLPGGGALRPSDVVTICDGTRVEVVDTDHEGRLVLADAIARACADRPDLLLDVATLTQAQIVALGSRTTGVMANDAGLRERVVEAATRAGESAWGMPLPEHLRPALDSTVADLRNYSPPEGTMLAAGLFLREFVVPEVRWAHLDITGPAWHDGDPYGYTPRGGTGAAVRTLVQVIGELGAVGPGGLASG